MIILFVAAIAPWPAAAQSGNSAVVNSCASILATTNNWCSVSRCGSLSVSFFRGGYIVEVSSEISKLALWGIYRFFTAIISVGVDANIPIIK